MKSIFYEFDATDTWENIKEEDRDKMPEVIIKSPLLTKVNSKTKKRNYCLTVTRLIQLDSKDQPKRSLNLCWKTLESFFETPPEGNQYGFTLSRYEFYVESSEMLDKWLFWLRRLTINTSFDQDFLIIKEVGEGVSSKIYQVEESNTRYQFAAKCFTKNKLKDDQFLFSSLAGEIKEVFSLNHEYIVRIFYLYESVDHVYLIMEYFPRGNLMKRLKRRGKFSEEVCRKFMINLLKTLDYMHEKKIMHRDIKPENIMMTSNHDYLFKIVDFGLAIEIEDRKIDDECGTTGYMAPEIIENRYYGVKVDVFSAGVVLYYIATGNHPFKGYSTKRMIKNNKDCKFDIKAIESPLLQSFLKDVLNPKPNLRKSAQELLDHPWINTEVIKQN